MRARLHGDAGEGTALIYVPGIDATGELMLGTTARLEEHFRLLRLEYVDDDETDTYAEIAASIAEIARMRHVDRCLLLSESFGGAVALRTALDHPDLVAGVAVVNGFAHFGRRAALAWSRFSAPLVPAWAFHLGRRWFAPARLFGGEVDDDTLRRFHELPPSAGFDRGYMRRMKMIAEVDLRAELPSLTQPVALFASTEDQVVDAVREAREMERRLPDATLEVLEGEGHVVLPLPDEPWVERMRALEARAFPR